MPRRAFCETFPQLWLFGLGALYIGVVMAFPDGLAGLWNTHIQPRFDRLFAGARTEAAASLDAPGLPSQPVSK